VRLTLGIALAWIAASTLVVGMLRVVDPPTSAFMLAWRWSQPADAAVRSPDWQWRDLDAIAPEMALAVIAAEDQRFADHHGFDLDAISDALADAERGGRLRGASTLSQQVAKNLFLWPGRSWVRKGLEAWFTALIELTWPKRRILEVHLNIAEFGPGVYGVEAASRRWFGRPAARLDAAQAARLAAVLPNPKVHRVDAPGPWVQQRERWIRRQMVQLGGVAWLERIDVRPASAR
jgi:monofunctional biosynthetic peptidoglycan transglycosylase